MPVPFDRRVTPVRPDLAAAELSGLVEAPRFIEGRPMQVTEASAPLRREPATVAPLETEALFGEWVTVYDESEGWGWVQLERDRYVGYLPLIALGPRTEPTHRVAALRTHAYPGPSIKLGPLMALSLGARTTIVREAGDFAVTADGLHLWARHLAEVGSSEADFVAVAERFLNAPYLWGGRTSEGIDCSGLVQAGPDGGRRRRSARQRPAGGRARRAGRARGEAGARRSRILEGPCRRHARRRHAVARQRLAHGGGQRAPHRGARPHRRKRRGGCDEREEAGRRRG